MLPSIGPAPSRWAGPLPSPRVGRLPRPPRGGGGTRSQPRRAPPPRRRRHSGVPPGGGPVQAPGAACGSAAAAAALAMARRRPPRTAASATATAGRGGGGGGVRSASVASGPNPSMSPAAVSAGRVRSGPRASGRAVVRRASARVGSAPRRSMYARATRRPLQRRRATPRVCFGRGDLREDMGESVAVNELAAITKLPFWPAGASSVLRGVRRTPDLADVSGRRSRCRGGESWRGESPLTLLERRFGVRRGVDGRRCGVCNWGRCAGDRRCATGAMPSSTVRARLVLLLLLLHS